MISPQYSSPFEELPPTLVDALRELNPMRCYLAMLPGRSGELELTELDRHPADYLFGQDLSSGLPSLAVVTPGQIVASREPSDLRPGTALTAVAIVSPTGVGALHLLWDGNLRRLAPNAEGLVPDAMRRALRLPTHPPELTPDWFWAWAWLDELDLIVQFDMPVGRLLDLEEVLAAHPALEVGPKARWDVASPLRAIPPGPDPDEPRLLSTLLDWHSEHSRLTGWTGIRRMLSVGDNGSLIGRAAAWYDDGSFSRWFVDVQPDLIGSLVRLRPYMNDQAMDLVQAVVFEVLDRQASSTNVGD